MTPASNVSDPSVWMRSLVNVSDKDLLPETTVDEAELERDITPENVHVFVEGSASVNVICPCLTLAAKPAASSEMYVLCARLFVLACQTEPR